MPVNMMSRALPAAAVLLACIVSGTVTAGVWRGRTGADLSLDFSDNVFLTEDDQQSDTLLSLTPRLNLFYSGSRRFSSSISYAPSIRYSVQGVRDNEIAHFLNADADAVLVRNVFGIRARASAGQRLIDRNAAFAGDGLANPDNITNTFRMEINPYLLPIKLGRYAVLTVDTGANLVVNEEGADSNGNRLNINLASGRMFTKTRWLLSYSRDFTQSDRDEDPGSTLGNLDARASYSINRKWSIDGAIGYDDLRANTLRDVDGLTWEAGMSWIPSPKSSFHFSYGERFNGRNLLFDFNHRHRQFFWQASLQRNITTANNEFLNRELFPSVDALGNPIEDPTQDPTTLEILPGPSLDETLFILDSLDLSANWGRRRTNLTLRLNYSQRDNLQEELLTDDLFLSLNLSRNLTARSAASIAASWINHTEDNNSDAEYQQWSGSLRYSNTLSNYLSFSIQYLLSHRDARASEDFTENRITLGLSTRLR